MWPDEATAEQRLADSRAQLESLLIRELLIREPGGFPRSHTMRFLLGGGGKALAAGVVAGLMAVKPALAASLLRILPLGRLMRRM